MLFTVCFGMPWWGLRENLLFIIYLFLAVLLDRNWKGPWTINGSDWGRVSVRDYELHCKHEWYKPRTVPMEGGMQQVSEEDSEKVRGYFAEISM